MALVQPVEQEHQKHPGACPSPCSEKPCATPPASARSCTSTHTGQSSFWTSLWSWTRGCVGTHLPTETPTQVRTLQGTTAPATAICTRGRSHPVARALDLVALQQEPPSWNCTSVQVPTETEHQATPLLPSYGQPSRNHCCQKRSHTRSRASQQSLLYLSRNPSPII